MILKDLLSPQFNDWILEIYDQTGQFLISTYERDTNQDDDWLNFIAHYSNNKVIYTAPAQVKDFMEVVIEV